MNTPASHRVLASPELLDSIFSRLSRKDNARNALVCDAWTNPARDHIWRVVETPCQLFKNLAPITCPTKQSHIYEHTIARVPTQADWRRFKPIAQRVRAVHVTAHSDTKCKGSLSTILSMIAVSQPHGGILPNLRLVDLAGASLNHGFMTLFSSSNLMSLTTCIPEDTEESSWLSFFEDLSAAAPNLQTLSLTASRNRGHRVKTFQAALGSIPEYLPQLTCLKLPLYFLTSSVLEVLSESSIAALDFSEVRNNTDNAGDVRDVLDINPELEEYSFSCLRRLSICGPLAGITSMLSHKHFPGSNITDIVIRATSAESERSIRDLITLFSEKFTSLGCLYLLFMPSGQSLSENADPSIVWPDDDELEPLTMDTFRPLCSMKQLQRFSVLHSQPLDIDDGDVLTLTGNLCNLRRLVLNPIPRVRSTPRLTLLSLIHIANNCPKIHSIALYADTTSPSLSYPTVITTPLPKVYLQLGASPITATSRLEVIKYLSRILHPGVVLKTTVSVFYDIPFPPTAFTGNWGWISERMALLLEVRQEERELQRARQEEYELRMQAQTEEEPEDDDVDSDGYASR